MIKEIEELQRKNLEVAQKKIESVLEEHGLMFNTVVTIDGKQLPLNSIISLPYNTVLINKK